MSCKYICDGCGKEEESAWYKTNPNQWCKPEMWFQRSDNGGIQDACSRECIQKVTEKSGKTNVVLPL